MITCTWVVALWNATVSSSAQHDGVWDYLAVKMNGCDTVYPKKYAHGFVVLCFVVVMQPFIMNSHEVFIHIHQGCFAGIYHSQLDNCHIGIELRIRIGVTSIGALRSTTQEIFTYFVGYTVLVKVNFDTRSLKILSLSVNGKGLLSWNNI